MRTGVTTTSTHQGSGSAAAADRVLHSPHSPHLPVEPSASSATKATCAGASKESGLFHVKLALRVPQPTAMHLLTGTTMFHVKQP